MAKRRHQSSSLGGLEFDSGDKSAGCGALNYRFSPGDYPDLFNYGPSAHFPVVPYPTTQVPDFHVDSVTGAAHGPCAKWGIGCS
jgi:hypothetical protein